MIGIIGNGSWATALVYNITRTTKVKWYVRSEDARESILKEGVNKRLPAAKLNTQMIDIYNDLASLIKDCDDIIIAAPSKYIADIFKRITYIHISKNFIIASKGLVDGKLISTYLYQKFVIPYDNIAVLSGPCHAEEVAQDKRCYLTIASTNYDLTLKVNNYFDSKYNTISFSNDILGVQIAAILKNIYAIAAGIFDELGYGVNFKAVLASNCAYDMNTAIRGYAIDKREYTYTDPMITKSAYLGDLLVTMYSEYSRNYLYGRSLIDDEVKVNGIVEGYNAVREIEHIIPLEFHSILRFVRDVIFKYERDEISVAAADLAKRLC